jgi:hypothetical protein
LLKEEIAMRSRLAVSALVVAVLVGATAIAPAQTQPAPGATKAHTNKGVAPNPSNQSANDAGTGRGK